MRYYSDLLPSYLDGENIRRHSGVIERSDRYLDGLVELFSLWDKLERPILIKREQLEGNGVNTVTLYVNTPSPIKEIIIGGDIEETITPTDSVTTSYEGTWTIENPSIHVGSTYIYLPEVMVTVRTETHTYTKAYPENDTIENNNADHDIFLDIVGGLLGIPRRKYSAWSSGISEPPYFAKLVILGKHQDRIFLECTEDDYYYKERLEYFITSTGNLRLFRAIYDKDAVLLNPEDFWIMDVGSPANVVFTHINKGHDVDLINKVNIDTTNIQEIAEQSLPVTRQTLILPYTNLIKYDVMKGCNVNFLYILLTVGLEQKTIDSSFSKEVPLTNLPIKITYSDGTEVGTWTTDETGTAPIIIKGARAGQQTLQWNITKEYPYFKVTDDRSIQYNASLFKLSLSDDAWQYKVANGTGVTNFEDPTILSNNNLNCGTGYMTYTPAINPALVDLSDYSVEVTFHYTTNAQRILFGTLEILEGDIAKITGLNIQPRAYASSNPSITDTHTLKFKFTDGVCSVYYDDVATGVSKDFNGTDEMLYIAGYNSRANGSTQGLHIEEISVGDEPTPTPVATSLSVTTVASTTGSASVKATLTSNGSGVSGATIQCKNGSTTLTSSTTDSNGECTLDLSTLQEGNYTLTIEYDGDSTYRSATTTHTITITSSVVITDDCTTLNNWNVSDTRTMPTLTTVANKTGVTPTRNSYARTFWKYPLVRGANSTISFKFYTSSTSDVGTLALWSLKKSGGGADLWAIRQYYNSWGKWGNDDDSDKQGSQISTNTWHDITYSLEDDVLKIYVDNTLHSTTTIATIDSNPYFNDYFFLGHGRWSNVSFVITDIEYTSDTVVSDSTIASIVAAHKAQF